MAIYDRLYNKYLQQLRQTQLVDDPNKYRKLTPQQFMAYYGNAAKEVKKYLPSLTKGHPLYETTVIGRVLDNSGYSGYEEKLAKAVGAASPAYRRSLQISIDNGIVYRNGEKLDEPYLNEQVTNKDKYNDVVVPAGTVFMMGDNRLTSKDSRFFGCVPIEKVNGYIVIRIWQLNKIGKL